MPSDNTNLPRHTIKALKILQTGGETTLNGGRIGRNECLREERKPTRCNNIDDLLSIVDVDY